MPPEISASNLVLYKERPATVAEAGSKLSLKLADGSTKSVRPKDVSLLHPGPVGSPSELNVPSEGDIQTAWELLAGESTSLEELCELIFGDFSPSSAWATWQLIAKDSWFSAEPTTVFETIHVRDAESVSRIQEERDIKARERAAWEAFSKRVNTGQTAPEDLPYLRSVEALALGQTDHSKVLKDLGRPVTAESAHAFLLFTSTWNNHANPYPARMGLALEPPDLPVPQLAEEDRLDLTHLEAFAIDDEGNEDPDDAISLDGGKLWIHVADVAALVEPDSPLDLEARARGANLYVPEKVVTMLPESVTHMLGLGLKEKSPALSFAVTLDEIGQVTGLEMALTWVKVTRLTYAEAEQRMDESPFREMAALTRRFRNHRFENGAAYLDLPEVKLKVFEGQIRISPLTHLASRDLVTDAMLMAGTALAAFAQENSIPIPYASQAPPDHPDVPTDLAGMFTYRKCFKRSVLSTTPSAHAGLGLPIYTRATSPLRRYSDLLVHQQCRAWLKQSQGIDHDNLLARMSQADMAAGQITRAERQANRHWILVFLLENPDWHGTGILVERRGKRGVILIPEFGMDTLLHVDPDIELNQPIQLKLGKINLPNQEAFFKVIA